MTSRGYVHQAIPELATLMSPPSFVEISGSSELDLDYMTRVAIGAVQLARRIGIGTPAAHSSASIPYSPATDQVVFDAPVLSWLLNKDVAFLRGWSMFESCIKGYNALGLIAEQVLIRHQALTEANATSIDEICRAFLRSRKVKGLPCFSSEEVDSLTENEVQSLDLLDVAIWQALADVRIVCSTSSNMGISLHDALRGLQQAEIRFQDRTFFVLNDDEGSLVIWCPDERADFMSQEKSSYLRSLEAQEPSLTRLRTYINRQERDPGALSDALDCGGYFFPTNPQSPDELQNLLYYALLNMSSTNRVAIEDLLDDGRVQATLNSLGCEIASERVLVRRGVEGGLGGLMVPYLLLAEELGAEGAWRGMSVWNQASIGAALASAVLADTALRRSSRLSSSTRYLLDSYFPNARILFSDERHGANIRTGIHGVFDLANVQSLAQLLGVVVSDHLSGKGTAFVGLGSASYSNGNRCFEILNQDTKRGGPFRGNATFHPATHALNPVAQALVFGEEVTRIRRLGARSVTDTVSLVQIHCRKPEPAGAAAVAGYLLTRLDRGSLSSVQIAYTLRLLGFDRDLFLSFAGLAGGRDGEQAFVQAAQEEGLRMRHLAVELMTLLEWPMATLKTRAATEAAASLRHDFIAPLDSPSLEALSPLLVLYLTGDNTSQPSSRFIRKLIENQSQYDDLKSTDHDKGRQLRNSSMSLVRRIDSALDAVGRSLAGLDRRIQSLRHSVVTRLAYRSVE